MHGSYPMERRVKAVELDSPLGRVRFAMEHSGLANVCQSRKKGLSQKGRHAWERLFVDIKVGIGALSLALCMQYLVGPPLRLVTPKPGSPS